MCAARCCTFRLHIYVYISIYVYVYTQVTKTLAEQKAAVLAAAALKKAHRREARQREETENLEKLRLARQADAALDESALTLEVRPQGAIEVLLLLMVHCRAHVHEM